MHRRGRSRIVSQAAIARQASEERHRNQLRHPPASQYHQLPLLPPPTSVASPSSLHISPPTSLSSSLPSPSFSSSPYDSSSLSDSSSMSSVDYNSPLSPPSSLEDQVHVAYALDNIHLAKILLLKLKGIHVTDDDDPRIDAVRDEDFDRFFVPSGKLTLDEAAEKSVLAAQRREREKWFEQRRASRLLACERIWDDEKRRLRHEKLRVLKKREEQAFLEEQEKKRQERLREAEAERIRHLQRSRVGSSHPPRRVVSYSSLSQSRLSSGPPPKQLSAEEPFQYQFMLSCSTPSAPPALPPPKIKKLSHSHIPPLGVGTLVSFNEVLTSMHGPLFPVDDASTKPHSCSSIESTPQQRRNAAHFELLDSLLKVVEWNEHERGMVKGKAPEREHTPSRRTLRREPKCAACSASAVSTTTTPSSSSSSSSSSTSVRSAPSRCSSWLSFSSRGSLSTAATTPSVSPISSWLKKPSSPSPAVLPKLSTTTSDIKTAPLRHSCHSRLTAIDASAGPLDLAVCERRAKPSKQEPSRGQISLVQAQDSSLQDALDGKSKTLATSVRKTVSSFLVLAKELQSAYINAVVFSISPSLAVGDDRERWRDSQERKGQRQEKLLEKRALSKLRLNAPGYRVHASDASIFLSDNSASTTSVPCSGPVIHLLSAEERGSPPRTTLPARRDLVFRPPTPLTRSPLRPREPPPPGSVLWRMRPVANPMLLRLKALQNVLWEREVGWEGRSREGGLGAGRERLCRVAFEGLGRSALGCEVRWVS